MSDSAATLTSDEVSAGHASVVPDLKAAALRYAAMGIPVFPLHWATPDGCSCGKNPGARFHNEICRSIGKHPRTRHGFKDASTDRTRIAEWWRKWPKANIGVPTGAASGWLVLDIDPRNGGDASLEKLLVKHGQFTDTAQQVTGGGGRHIVFKDPGVAVVDVLASGIDVKGGGGYIVVAPSLHNSGNRYWWNDAAGAGPPLKPIAAPAWLLERITKASASPRVRKPGPARIPSPDYGETWQTGERNTRLASLAGALWNCGLTRGALEAAMSEQNRERCDPPLDTGEVLRICESIARYPAGNLTAFTPAGYDTAFDAFLDVVRFTADLPGFPVLLYHVERSLGYGKAADRTSLSQIVGGVASRTLNAWIRKGCGLGKDAVIRAHRALSKPDRPFLRVRHHSSPERGHEPTEFEVNWDWLAEYIAERKRDSLPPLVSQKDTPLVAQKDTHNHIALVKGDIIGSDSAIVERGEKLRKQRYRGAAGL